MDQQDVLSILEEEGVCENLDIISKIHMITKHYLLIAEELSEEGATFLQPLKEHRDAYDHLMRIFYLPTRLDNAKNIDSFDHVSYIKKNIEKAVGHEYRAFFDMADWLTFVCRKKIRTELTYKKKQQAYVAHYGEKDFQSVKELINEIPFTIARYRTEKDIGKKEQPLLDVQTYKNTIDSLLQIYQRVMLLP